MAYLYPISKKKKRDREIYDKSEVYSELKNLSREIKELRLEISDLKKSRKRKRRSRQPKTKSYSSKEQTFYPLKEYSFSTYSYRSGDDLIKKYREARDKRIEIMESTEDYGLWALTGGFGAFLGFVISSVIAPSFPEWLYVTGGFGLLGSVLGWYLERDEKEENQRA